MLQSAKTLSVVMTYHSLFRVSICVLFCFISWIAESSGASEASSLNKPRSESPVTEEPTTPLETMRWSHVEQQGQSQYASAPASNFESYILEGCPPHGPPEQQQAGGRLPAPIYSARLDHLASAAAPTAHIAATATTATATQSALPSGRFSPAPYDEIPPPLPNRSRPEAQQKKREKIEERKKREKSLEREVADVGADVGKEFQGIQGATGRGWGPPPDPTPNLNIAPLQQQLHHQHHHHQQQQQQVEKEDVERSIESMEPPPGARVRLRQRLAWPHWWRIPRMFSGWQSVPHPSDPELPPEYLSAKVEAEVEGAEAGGEAEAEAVEVGGETDALASQLMWVQHLNKASWMEDIPRPQSSIATRL